MNAGPGMSARIGILGGTFDPVHIGHLVLAVRAREQLGLTELLLIPNARSPLKENAPVASFADRLAMLDLAVGHLDSVTTSDIEGRRGGVSYMIDTLRALDTTHHGASWLLIMGNDAARDLDSWHEADAIRKCATIAVVARSGASPVTSDTTMHIEMPRIDISASDIRARVAAGQSIEFLTPVAVVDYIRAHDLYRTP